VVTDPCVPGDPDIGLVIPPVLVCQHRGMLRLTDVIIDCPDTMALAAFYAEVTGLPVGESRAFCLCRNRGVTGTEAGPVWP